MDTRVSFTVNEVGVMENVNKNLSMNLSFKKRTSSSCPSVKTKFCVRFMEKN